MTRGRPNAKPSISNGAIEWAKQLARQQRASPS